MFTAPKVMTETHPILKIIVPASLKLAKHRTTSVLKYKEIIFVRLVFRNYETKYINNFQVFVKERVILINTDTITHALHYASYC